MSADEGAVSVLEVRRHKVLVRELERLLVSAAAGNGSRDDVLTLPHHMTCATPSVVDYPVKNVTCAVASIQGYSGPGSREPRFV